MEAKGILNAAASVGRAIDKNRRFALWRTAVFIIAIVITVLYNVGALQTSDLKTSWVFEENFTSDLAIRNNLQSLAGRFSWWIDGFLFPLSNLFAMAYPQSSVPAILESSKPADGVFRVAAANTVFVLLYGVGLYIWNLRSNATDEQHRKWADSIYYLGFSLTLLALILALGDAGRILRNPTATFETLIVQQAVALASTLAGLFVRTVYTLSIPILPNDENDDGVSEVDQFCADVKNVSDAIKESGKQLKGAVSSVVHTVEHFHGQVNHAGEVYRKILNRLDDSSQAFSEHVKELDKELKAVVNAHRDDPSSAVVMRLVALEQSVQEILNEMRSQGREQSKPDSRNGRDYGDVAASSEVYMHDPKADDVHPPSTAAANDNDGTS